MPALLVPAHQMDAGIGELYKVVEAAEVDNGLGVDFERDRSPHLADEASAAMPVSLAEARKVLTSWVASALLGTSRGARRG